MLSALRNRLNQILHLEDTPHRLAWGAALGLFVAWTPTIGVQMAVAGVCAALLRANKLIAMTVVWITNPYTAVPIYWFNYMVGHWLVGGEEVNRKWFQTLLTKPDPEMAFMDYLDYAYGKLAEVAFPLILGSCVVGFIIAAVTYPLAYRHFKRRDERRALQSVPAK